MNQEDKDLLFKDLCTRLPYKPRVKYYYKTAGTVGIHGYSDEGFLSFEHLSNFSESNFSFYNRNIYNIVPYLRPMSSMTEEDEKELLELDLAYWDEGKYTDEDGYVIPYGKKTLQLIPILETYDWLNSRHFDYRGLIEKGLAIAVTEENNLYKN